MLFSARLLFVLTVAGLLLLGWGIARRLWTRLWSAEEPDAPGGLERATAALTIAFGVWLAVDWTLALTHTLTREMLFARTAAVLAAGLALVPWKSLQKEARLPRDPWLLCAIPVVLWVWFEIWRAMILPPLTHDALSNHLPRALLWARVGGFLDLTLISPQFRDMPANYELLLADMLSMLRHDRYTEWLSTICYLAFIVVSGALAWRWWRSKPVTALTMLLIAGSPIVLLQSGADKNDLLVATFMVSALIWAGRYWTSGDYRSLLLLGTSLLIALGTKPQAAFLGAVLLPFVIRRMLQDLKAKRLSPRAAGAAVAFGVIAFFALGGITYADQHLREAPPGAPVVRQARVISYGDWANLWQGPYILAMAPFERSPYVLHVPWSETPWFWKRYEIYMSHLGVPFALCLAGAPFALAAWREKEGRKERLAMGAAALLALIAQLPANFRPHGVYAISLPRYAMFIAPVVIAWTLGALLRAAGPRTRRLPAILAAGAVAFFIWYGIDFAVHDSFAPLEFVLIARHYPGTRYVPFDPYRATSRLDAMAGPRDLVAVDGAFASWVHPVFGRNLSRPVYFIPPGDGPVRIPPNAKWVVVERAYEVIWGSKEMKSIADARRLFGRNPPRPDELRVVEALRADPRFELVWEERNRNQAIFRRKTGP